MADRSAQNALHGETGLTLLHPSRHVFGILVVLRIESSDSQQIQHLLIHLVFAVDNAIDHLFRLVVERWDVEREIQPGIGRCSGNVHKAIHLHIVGRKALSHVQVC